MQPLRRIATAFTIRRAAADYTFVSHTGLHIDIPSRRARLFSTSTMRQDPFKPAARVAGQRQDVWTIVNEAATASPVQPIVNMGQGFFGYNPPEFVLEAARDALSKVECNQYSPTKGYT